MRVFRDVSEDGTKRREGVHGDHKAVAKAAEQGDSRKDKRFCMGKDVQGSDGPGAMYCYVKGLLGQKSCESYYMMFRLCLCPVNSDLL